MKRGFLKNGLSGGTPTNTRMPTAARRDPVPANDRDVPSAHPPPRMLELKSASPAEGKDYLQRQGMKTKVMEGKARQPAILGFGCGREGDDPTWDTLVISYAENRTGLRDHPCFQQTIAAELAVANAEAVKVSLIPGKGRALIAKRDFPAGQLILRERPLLFMISEVPIDIARNMDQLLQHMTKEHRAAYERLYNCKPRGSHMVDSMSIARTNALSAGELFGEDRHLCVCELISRANHDCTPNAGFNFNHNTFCGELTSVMPITAGTEITITYAPLMAPAVERKAELKEKWGFVCTCPACDETSPSFKASEERRQILQDYLRQEEIQQSIETKGLWTGYEESYIERILELVDKERLFESRPVVLANFAEMEASHAVLTGDYTRVLKLCQRGLEELKKLGANKQADAQLKIDALLEKGKKTKEKGEEMAKMADEPVDDLSLEAVIKDFRRMGDTSSSRFADDLQRYIETHRRSREQDEGSSRDDEVRLESRPWFDDVG